MQGKLVGYGYYVPEKILTNFDLEQQMNTTDEWIFSRTGIKQRHIAAENETCVDMAAIATKRALDRAGLSPNDIDCIIFATITYPSDFPCAAQALYAALGMTNNAPAFDVKAACSGFVYAMHQARAFFAAGLYKRILLIGAEKMSDILDWSDRNTAVLFGDGAAAMIFEGTDDKNIGLIASKIYSDGSKAPLLYQSPAGKVVMDGKEVYKLAVQYMPHVGEEVLADANMTKDDITWLLPHQANIRIIKSAADRMGFPMERVITSIDRFANTSGASGALAFAYAAEMGQIKPGDTILYTAFGAGLTWGAGIIKI
jgi:3-oxoacyl-[acyl-carrier-protein] synthase-3